MTKRIMNHAALLALALLTATACTRRVQVESEPNEPSYMQSTAAIEMAGTYDYVVMTAQGEVESGPMTVTRAGDSYAVRFGMTQAGGEVVGRNVRREGNTLSMDADTPAGAGTLELTWQSRNEVTGSGFFGETLSIRATRRS